MHARSRAHTQNQHKRKFSSIIPMQKDKKKKFNRYNKRRIYTPVHNATVLINRVMSKSRKRICWMYCTMHALFLLLLFIQVKILVNCVFGIAKKIPFFCFITVRQQHTPWLAAPFWNGHKYYQCTCIE